MKTHLKLLKCCHIQNHYAFAGVIAATVVLRFAEQLKIIGCMVEQLSLKKEVQNQSK